MRRMGVSVGGLLFAELFIRRFLRRSRYRHSGRTLFFDDVEDPRDGDGVAGLHFLERDFQRHAFDLVRAVLKLPGKILPQSLLVAPNVPGNAGLGPTCRPKQAHKLLIFIGFRKRWPSATILDWHHRFAEQIVFDILAGKIVCHGKKNLRMWGTRVRKEAAFQTFDRPPCMPNELGTRLISQVVIDFNDHVQAAH